MKGSKLIVSQAEYEIIAPESHFDPHADNPTSTAFGIGQLLEGNRIKYASLVRKKNPLLKDYNTTKPVQQLQMFRAYIPGHGYGTAEKALAFRKLENWY